MDLKDILVRFRDLHDLFSSLGRFQILCVVGVYTDSCEYNIQFFVYLDLDLPDQLIDLISSIVIRHLDMHGSVIVVRSVIIKDQIIDPPHIVIFHDGFFNFPGKLGVDIFSEDL